MEYTTSLPPENMMIKFYQCFPVDTLEQREDSYIKFSLDADKKFPTNLLPVMKKTGRVLSFTKSSITGVANPACEGDGCSCENCPTPSMVCSGNECGGYTISTDNITCSKSSCTPTNNVSYTMRPLYPAVSAILSKYSPKIKFIKYISPAAGTPPPQGVMTVSSPLPNMEFAIFSIVYPTPEVFQSSDAYSELVSSVLQNKFLEMVNEKKYAEHNVGMLQKLAKKYKLSTTNLKKPSVSPPPSDKKQQSSKQTTIDQKQLQSRPPPPMKETFYQIIEGYTENTDDVDIGSFEMSTTSEDNTEPEEETLETPDPNMSISFKEGSGPQPNSSNQEKKKQTPVYIWIVVGLAACMLIGGGYYYMTASKSKTTKPKRKQQQS